VRFERDEIVTARELRVPAGGTVDAERRIADAIVLAEA